MSDRDENLQELYGEFLDETRDLLDSFQQHLVRLENEPGNHDLIKKIFRVAHTIKGNAGFIGLVPLGELSHAMESILGQLRDEKMVFSPDINDALLEGVDAARGVLKEFLADNLASVDVSDIIDRLHRIEKHEPVLVSGRKQADESWSPDILDHHEESEKPADAPAPRLEALPGGKATAPAAADEADASRHFMRVSADRLDQLVNLVGELVAGRSRLLQLRREIPLKSFEEVSSFISNIATELQSAVLSIRMVPISQLFNRFYRPVRDTARQIGKDVQLVMEGEDTELDKTIVEEIHDPLLHLVRNAIGHGIELPENRVQAGKKPRATVLLKAYHAQNSVFVEVIDDGVGLNYTRISEKAVERGLMSRDELRGMEPAELAELIFLPGFSTAGKVDDLQGRGVGLDVVKSKVEHLGGNVEVLSTPGEGTLFRLKLPLTLAILQIFLVKYGKQTFGIPLNYVDETVRVRKSELERVKGQQVMMLRHHAVSITTLGELFGQKAPAELPDILNVIILRVYNRRVGVIVSELLGKEETVLKPLGPYIGSLEQPAAGIAGASILGTGEVVLIIDVPLLVRSSDVGGHAAEEQGAGAR